MEFSPEQLSELVPWSLWSEWGVIGSMDIRFILASEHRGIFQVHKDPLDPIDFGSIVSDLRSHLSASESVNLPPHMVYDPDNHCSSEPPSSPSKIASDHPPSPSKMELLSNADTLSTCYYRGLGYYYKQRSTRTPHVSNLPPFIRRLVHQGVPCEFREHLWLLVSGGRNALLSSYSHSSASAYSHLALRHEQSSHQQLIQLDISRTYKETANFHKSGGACRTQRVLEAYSLRNPGLGYCQGLSYLAALLNTHCSEEVAYTLLCVVLEDGLVPPDYYTNLTGAVVDQQVLESLMMMYTPGLYKRLEGGLEDFTVGAIPWFMCLYAATFDSEVAARVWDFLFVWGSCVLFRVALGVLRVVEGVVVGAGVEGVSDVRSILSEVIKGVRIEDIEEYVEMFEDSVTDKMVAGLRERHRLDKVANSSCQLTVLLDDGASSSGTGPEAAVLVEDYFVVSPKEGVVENGRRSRRKRIVKEIDAFLGSHTTA